jgi:hypothetical protein
MNKAHSNPREETVQIRREEAKAILEGKETEK